MPFDYASVFAPDLPPAAARYGGFPKYNFIGGHNDGEMVPVEDFIAASGAVLAREGRTLATYGLQSGPQGYRPLREFLSRSLEKRTGMTQSADDILMVSGSLQALDLVNDVLTRRGDTVLLEAATYGGTLTRLQRRGVNYVGVAQDADGMRMDALEQALADLKAKGTTPKYIYVIPTVQNPTGSVMPEARRLELLKIARSHGVPIFEDDCYAELTFDGTRPKAIRALDDQGQVIYCGSFSKTIAPALRIGYIAAEWPVIARMLAMKQDGGTGALEQMILAEYCTRHFDDHVTDLTKVLKGKCDAIVEALESEFGTSAELSIPKGGIFIWVTLPANVDTTKLAQAAAAEGVALNAGAEWMADKDDGRRRLRLCFGHPPIPVIKEGVAKLAEVCHREFGVPLRGRNVER
jgi:2-aminoadipate transaminase